MPSAVCRRTEPRPKTNQHSENNHITKPPHSLVMTVVYFVPCGKRTVVVPWHSSLPLFIVSVYCCLPLDSHIHSTTSRLRVLQFTVICSRFGVPWFDSIRFCAVHSWTPVIRMPTTLWQNISVSAFLVLLGRFVSYSFSLFFGGELLSFVYFYSHPWFKNFYIPANVLALWP